MMFLQSIFPVISLLGLGLALSPSMNSIAARDIPLPSPEKSAEVGWQSLFWPLFILALLAMSQPSILDRGFPQSGLLFPARASPLVCATDALEVLIHLRYEIIEGTPLRIAASRVCLRRLQERCGGAEQSQVLDRSAIKLHQKTSLVLFIYGLAQLVKVLGFQGVVWAQIIAAAYMGSYLVLAGVAILARDDESSVVLANSASKTSRRSNSQGASTGPATLLGHVSLFASLLTYSWAIFQVCYNGIEGSFTVVHPFWSHDKALGTFLVATLFTGMWLRLGVSMLILFLAVAVIVLTVFQFLEEYQIFASWPFFWTMFVKTFYALLISIPAVILFSTLTPVLTLYDGKWRWFTDGSGAFVLGVGLAWLVVESLEVVCQRVKFLTAVTPKRDWGFCLGVCSLIELFIACLYLSCVYDSTGTFKPGWTETWW